MVTGKRYRITKKTPTDSAKVQAKPEGGPRQVALLRSELGQVLRSVRQRQRRTLRDVSVAARVSLGYLSEVERGQKEASSELLASICEALDLPMSATLRQVSDRMAQAEGHWIPDSPADLVERSSAMAGIR
ncbi:MAG: helix-turn-helix domain-containing protein [Micrococcales bacterium]|nr:helix-turn-helix domain-containing protein [Micrococcales bacterium]